MIDRDALRALAVALPAGSAVPVPREWLLDLLDGAATPSATSPDLTVAEVAERFRRAPSTVRSWILAGRLRAYRFQGRELRVSRDALEAFEATQRPKPRGENGVTSIQPARRTVDLTEYRTAS